MNTYKTQVNNVGKSYTEFYILYIYTVVKLQYLYKQTSIGTIIIVDISGRWEWSVVRLFVDLMELRLTVNPRN